MKRILPRTVFLGGYNAEALLFRQGFRIIKFEQKKEV